MSRRDTQLHWDTCLSILLSETKRLMECYGAGVRQRFLLLMTYDKPNTRSEDQQTNREHRHVPATEYSAGIKLSFI